MMDRLELICSLLALAFCGCVIWTVETKLPLAFIFTCIFGIALMIAGIIEGVTDGE